MRQDEGGTHANAPAMPAQAGGAGGGVNPAFTAARTKRAIRQGQAFAFLYESQTDANIRQMLADLAETSPAELAGDAWDLVVNECDEPSDDLEISKMNLIWSSMSILNTVGYAEDTITQYARELNNVNARRPTPYDENEKSVKFLSSITFPESLAKDALKELKARGDRREFHRGGPAFNRHYVNLVQHFDALWRSLFVTLPINPRAPQRGQRHETALLHTDENDDVAEDDDPAVYLVTMDDGEMIFYMGTRRDFTRRPGAARNGPRPVRFQRVCRNCWGMDHHASQCPSPAQDRDLGDVMEVHQRIRGAAGGGTTARNVGETDARNMPRFTPAPPTSFRPRSSRPTPRRAPGGDANLHTDESEPAPTEDEINVVDDTLYVIEVECDTCTDMPLHPVPVGYKCKECRSNPCWCDYREPETDGVVLEDNDDGLEDVVLEDNVDGLIDPFDLTNAYEQMESEHDLYANDPPGYVQMEHEVDDPDLTEMLNIAHHGYSRDEFEPDSVITRVEAAPDYFTRRLQHGNWDDLTRHEKDTLVAVDVIQEAYRNQKLMRQERAQFLRVRRSLRQLQVKWRLQSQTFAQQKMRAFRDVIDITDRPTWSTTVDEVYIDATYADEFIYGLEMEGNEWLIDSGATKHVTPHESDLYACTNPDPKLYVRVGDGKRCRVTAIGHVLLTVAARKKNGATLKKQILLRNVLVVPDCRARLISTRVAFDQSGIRTFLNDDLCLATNDGSIIPFAPSETAHYRIGASCNKRPEAAPDVLQIFDDPDLIHRRFAHFSDGRVESTLGTKIGDRHDCSACHANARGASHSRKSKTQLGADKKWTHFGQRISSDLILMCDTSSSGSIPNGFKYMIVFVDAYSFYVAVRFLRTKDPSEVLEAFQSFVDEYDEYLVHGIGEWHTDNGGEFQSSDLEEFCATLLMRHTTIVPETPQDNAQAERMNGVILRATRILLADANLDDRLWPFACVHGVNAHNSLQSRTTDPPAEPAKLANIPFNRDLLKVWGCRAWISMPSDVRRANDKTAPRNIEALNLGYSRTRRAYNVYIPMLKRFAQVRPNSFEESHMLVVPEFVRRPIYKSIAQRTKPVHVPRNLPVPDVTRDAPAAPADDAAAVVPAHVIAARNIAARARAATGGEDVNFAALAFSAGGTDDDQIFHIENVDPWEPQSYEEAVHPDNPYRDKWIEAMVHDLKGKAENGENGTWTDVDEDEPRRKGRKVMKGKWTFKLKWDTQHTVIVEFKARWVAKGFTQIEGQDYSETFSSTLRGTTLRCFASEVALNGYVLNGADVVKAFSTSVMPDELYIEHPHGFGVPGKCCKLNQALEGTKQAAHLWQQNLNDHLVNDQSMTRSQVDPCLYTKETEHGKLIIIVWVDDLCCASTTQDIFDEFFDAFSKKYRAKKIPNMDKFVGVELVRDDHAGTVTLRQTKYIEKLYERHLSKRNTKAWQTPVGTSREEAARFEAIDHAMSDVEMMAMSGKSILQLLGGILFASCMTRPDVAYATAFLCQYMMNPSPAAYDAALGILAYMYETRKLGITYGGPPRKCPVPQADGTSDLLCFADSSFGKTPYPFGGGLVMHGNAVVAYFSRKVKFPVPDSSCYAELNVIVSTLKEAIFTSHIIFDMSGRNVPPLIVTDSKAAHDIIKNPGVTKHSIHFERWIYLARDYYLHGKAKYLLTGTANMMADGMTKVTDKTKFFLCRNYAMNI